MKRGGMTNYHTSFKRSMAVNLSIPISLANLFKDVNFLSMAPDGCKPCFKRKCYVRNDFVGWAIRRYDGENFTSTITKIENVCKSICESLVNYKNTQLYPLILEKMILLRNGIKNIMRSYENNYEALSSIQNAILTLDLNIPIETEYKE